MKGMSLLGHLRMHHCYFGLDFCRGLHYSILDWCKLRTPGATSDCESDRFFSDQNKAPWKNMFSSPHFSVLYDWLETLIFDSQSTQATYRDMDYSWSVRDHLYETRYLWVRSIWFRHVVARERKGTSACLAVNVNSHAVTYFFPRKLMFTKPNAMDYPQVMRILLWVP